MSGEIENGQRAGALLLLRQPERDEIIQSREEKAPETFLWPFINEVYKKVEADFLAEFAVIGQGSLK